MRPWRIAWRRTDGSGSGECRVGRTAAGLVLRGTFVGMVADHPLAVDWGIEVTETWQTRRVRVTAHHAGRARSLRLSRGQGGIWRVNGRVRGALEGCDDVDLAITPATNTLPIRRLDPGVGAEVATRAAWVRFPSLAVEPALQHYRNLGGGRFRYERRAGPVRAELEADARGLVTRYGDSWEQVARPRRSAPELRS